MKNIFKNNKILIIVVAILLGWGLLAANDYRNWWNQTVEANEYYMEKCETEYLNDPQYKQYCSELAANYPLKKSDTISIFFDILGNYSLRFIQIVAPLFIVTVAIWNFHKQLKTGFIKNIMTRMEYKKYIKSNIVRSWGYALILPVFLIIMFFISYLLSGHFDVRYTIENNPGYLFIDSKYIDVFPQFVFTYLLTLILHSIFWINLGYILSKKSRNIIVMLLSFFLTYIVIFMASEILIGGFILSNIFNIRTAMNYLNLSNIWVYEGINNLMIPVVYGLFLAVTSLLFVIKVYKDREGVIIENEK